MDVFYTYQGGLWRAIEICRVLAQTNTFAISSSTTVYDVFTNVPAESHSMSGMSDTTSTLQLNIKGTHSTNNLRNESSSTTNESLAEIRIQTFKPTRSGLSLPFTLGSLSSLISAAFSGESATCYDIGRSDGSGESPMSSSDSTGALYICDDIIATMGVASSDSMGVSQALSAVGGGPLLAYLMKHLPAAQLIEKMSTK